MGSFFLHAYILIMYLYIYTYIACYNYGCSLHKSDEERSNATEGRVYMEISYIPLARKDEEDLFTEEELRRRLELQNLDFMVCVIYIYIYIYMYLYVYLYLYMYSYGTVYFLFLLHLIVHAFTHTYIHTYTSSYMHIYNS